MWFAWLVCLTFIKEDSVINSLTIVSFSYHSWVKCYLKYYRYCFFELWCVKYICDPPYEKGAYGNFQKTRLNTAFKRFSNMFQTVLKHVWNGFQTCLKRFQTCLKRFLEIMFETVLKQICLKRFLKNFDCLKWKQFSNTFVYYPYFLMLKWNEVFHSWIHSCLKCLLKHSWSFDLLLGVQWNLSTTVEKKSHLNPSFCQKVPGQTIAALHTFFIPEIVTCFWKITLYSLRKTHLVKFTWRFWTLKRSWLLEVTCAFVYTVVNIVEHVQLYHW